MPIRTHLVRQFNTTESEWPDATNTGVPPGTTLTPYSGDYETSSNGQTVQDLDIDGSLVINHDNVLVRRCKVTSSSFAIVYFTPGATGTTIEDCELTGDYAALGSQALYMDDDEPLNVTARRLNIYGVTDAAQIYADGFTMHDCYMHDYVVGEPSHADGVQTSFGVGDVWIYHNTFDFTEGHAQGGGAATDGGMSSGFQFQTHNPTDGEPNHDWLVEDNLFLVLDSGPAPCAYTIRLPEVATSPHATYGERNLRVINNRFTEGIFGYVQTSIDNILEWSGNVDHITGDPVP